ncbi:energy-coupling factor transporter ATP-binding protein EcfA1 [Clostridium acetireducens DSM 10703]|uniref:Energy-coupling factor transporter ATP-binding protein EcfA1 n=1 Tax=Clostridium acetireducens DSM 10703 TaxID=1121290 RepID=A0A1E8EZX8_9CLOT|nr:ATP-binding cassette domain-containing protein [Clostridium acetireducens]OFI06720.1 energy-coupling factor transporter ATP-binding protein EcfA1 [Clostridium acetireducens DSM 10703]
MLKLQNLCKTFNKNTINEVTLFNDLSLNVNEGDFITVIGSNGAGKSTLLNMISGNIKPDSGTILLKGKNISNMPEHKCMKYIGKVFQNPSHGVASSMTILENMSMAINKGKRFGLQFGINKKNMNYFKEVLSNINLGLEDKLDTKVGLLSGGQRQALCLIMTTLTNPEILLLDEHTAALDPKTSEIVLNITKDIVEKRNLTTLMITHNLKQAISLGNRLIMLHKGNVVLDISGKEKRNLTIEKLLNTFETLNFQDISDKVLFA